MKFACLDHVKGMKTSEESSRLVVEHFGGTARELCCGTWDGLWPAKPLAMCKPGCVSDMMGVFHWMSQPRIEPISCNKELELSG